MDLKQLPAKFIHSPGRRLAESGKVFSQGQLGSLSKDDAPSLTRVKVAKNSHGAKTASR